MAKLPIHIKTLAVPPGSGMDGVVAVVMEDDEEVVRKFVGGHAEAWFWVADSSVKSGRRAAFNLVPTSTPKTAPPSEPKPAKRSEPKGMTPPPQDKDTAPLRAAARKLEDLLRRIQEPERVETRIGADGLCACPACRRAARKELDSVAERV